MDCTKCCELLIIVWYFLNMSVSDFNIINSVSDSDIICVRQILTSDEFILLCYSK